NVSQRNLPVRIRVRSGTPLKMVRVVRKGQPSITVALPAQQQPDAAGVYEFKQDLTVQLAGGLNPMYLEAENDADRQISRNLTVNYVPRPAQLIVERLVPRDAGIDPIVPTADATAVRPLFPQVTTGRVRLEGRVCWGDEELEGTRKKFQFVR